jgi:hypothetical protein
VYSLFYRNPAIGCDRSKGGALQMVFGSRFGRGPSHGRRLVEGSGPQKGARFVKLVDRNHVWVVDKVFQPEGLKSPHAVLVREDSASERIVIAQSVLLDPQMYVPEEIDE